VNRDVGSRRANELRAHPQGTTASGCLRRARAPIPPGGMRRPKNHFFHGGVEFLTARRGHVGFRGLRRQDRLLGSTHASEHRRIAAQVAVYAHAEVDLRWRRIGSIFGHQSENRIGAQLLKVLKQVSMPHFLCAHIIVHADMLISRTCILNLTLALGGAIACAAATYGADAAKTVPRIISLSPHITELLFAAGAGDRIVGVDDSSDYPAAVAGIARSAAGNTSRA